MSLLDTKAAFSQAIQMPLLDDRGDINSNSSNSSSSKSESGSSEYKGAGSGNGSGSGSGGGGGTVRGTQPTATTQPALSGNVQNAGFMVLNIVSSVGIVLANKWVFDKEHFRFGTVLTVIHFVVTFVGLELCAAFGLFQRKRIPLREVVGLCAMFSAFVVLTNLSLQYNSVGFYQMAKVLTTPFIVIIKTAYYKTSYSNRIKASLAVTCLGVAISSATDVKINLIGTLLALAGVAASGMYQIWVGTRQKELDVNSFQLLYYQAPISAFMLLFCVPVLDDVGKLLEFEMSMSTLSSILLSAALAFFVNLSTFLIIGKTSPITYNVVGHFKLCVVVILGFIIFRDPVIWKNILGISIALVGVFWYSYINLS